MKENKIKELEEKLEKFKEENNQVMIEKTIEELNRLNESFNLDEVISETTSGIPLNE